MGKELLHHLPQTLERICRLCFCPKQGEVQLFFIHKEGYDEKVL